jgi:hypothetical protein
LALLGMVTRDDSLDHQTLNETMAGTPVHREDPPVASTSYNPLQSEGPSLMNDDTPHAQPNFVTFSSPDVRFIPF